MFQECRKAERINSHLKRLLATYPLPDVMKYVNDTANLRQLKRKAKNWQKKVEIASVSAAESALIIFDRVPPLRGS